ncbi:helix-turn-helix domain-containing protein [Fulvivirgaceae bacterium PWU5]|uniref:Helix-turn-helix domain-containing protein n=1 Tax=Dawidia cretensis TaxID=2782350 RepID=A0AAP2DYQ8_9BACT|nr:helix-turn-helix domain-containing protein [Dawidia cretensis]MBT1708894.1 helix-turn-helix domain-containing protein [Dawidia cretensis]
MKHATILIPNGQSNLSSIVGAYKFLIKANQYHEQRGEEKIFTVQLVGVQSRLDLYDGLFSITPHAHIDSVKKTDLIIIPAGHYDFERLVRDNQEIIAWLQHQYKRGAEVASICTGAFILAATGLLDGKGCSTHWNAARAFRQMFPEVTLLPDKLVTDENGLYTNGGAFSYLNLMLYLVEKYYDRATAVFCAKIFQVDINRTSQSPFVIFEAQKDHEDDLIKKAQLFIEEHLRERISMEDVAERYTLSRRNFDRRFIKATGNTPLEYQQRLKIELAKKMLETSRRTVKEVMYESGYADAKAFRETFRKITGLLPLDYRSRYNKEFVTYR